MDFIFPNNRNEFIESLRLRKIPFDLIKRENFKKNSSLIKLLDKYFQEENLNKNFFLPELKTFGNESIAVFSDYGGEHEGSKYNSYSFLFCGWNHCYPLSEEFQHMREKYNLAKKEIPFKALSYGPIYRCLEEYFDLIDKYVLGFSLTILIDKNIKSLFLDKSNEDILAEIEKEGFGKWNYKTVEKLMRILHTIGYVLPLIADEKQKIIWFTDNDPVLQNKVMLDNVLGLMNPVFEIYSNNKYKTIGLSKLPFYDKDIFTMDMLSICDLIAGTVEQLFSTENKEGIPLVKKEGEKVINWLRNKNSFLIKEIVRISLEDNKYILESVKFEEEN